MTSGIFYSARSFLGREGKGIVRHLDILSNSCDKIDHLSNRKTDSVKEQIMKCSSVQINQSLNLFGDFYESSALNMSHWMDVYNSLDEIGRAHV